LPVPPLRLSSTGINFSVPDIRFSGIREEVKPGISGTPESLRESRMLRSQGASGTAFGPGDLAIERANREDLTRQKGANVTTSVPRSCPE
jgi:hypothetical protein